ncbi:MAG: hypothetical protein KF716_25180 [Anaerolineae bacterium]|nr:hypothetical protein [Anaerolineae bacterium]
MAILALFTGEGITRQMYDALRQKVDWEHQHPNGSIVHIASFDEAGTPHVADVWSSPETLNEFVGTRLMPAMQALGIPQPDVVVYPVHNLNAFPAILEHLVKEQV